MWTPGPSFLMQCEGEWPMNPENIDQLLLNDPEVRNITANPLQACEEVDPVMTIIHHFSSWTKLKTAVAWLLKFKRWIMASHRKKALSTTKPTMTNGKQQPILLKNEKALIKQDPVKRCLNVEDVEEAEEEIIKYCQKRKFEEELSCLQSGAKVKRSSHVYKLCPFIKNGILRVGGRLSRSSMPLETKHPAILAKDSHIANLILQHVHHQVGHGGRNHMLSKLREKYWITGACSAIRSILRKCVLCRRLNAQPMSQHMADLPKERITPDEPPFTCVGVDYFGPFEVKSRRSLVKRYGVIFSCMALRAIHIEVASSLDTDSFINALRRFITRRGQVKEIRSDNGTNFVGAERELRTAVDGWNQAKINSMLLQKGINEMPFLPRPPSFLSIHCVSGPNPAQPRCP
ncbi:uncharacterized protein LOC112147751 [Oryzias melastigma]|uniref:uncharacterized protein LOC112147751 n=1 Tax=Oryzias melastigma TaxID=30732 RepID=UPI00168CEAD1|nr:uncharacterized protein LOC112147751 [Oryzias melastigma]